MFTKELHQAIEKAREKFYSSGIVDTNVVRKDIAESWQRSKSFGVNPYNIENTE